MTAQAKLAERDSEPPPAMGGASPRPAVMQVLPSLATGGVERGTIDVAAAVVAAGGKAVVVSSGGQMVRELERAGAVHVQLPVHSKNPLVMYRNVARLAGLIDEHGVDILHARSRAPAWSAWRAARAKKVAFVTTFHGTYGHSNLIKRRYNSVMLKGDRVIAISHFIADHIRDVYGLDDPERVRVIHRGIDIDLFAPERVTPERLIALAEHWRVTEGMPIVMLPGRLTSWKGQKLLIEALALLGRNDIRCLLVGSDQGRHAYRRSLDNLIERRGLAGVVQIADHCRDMPAAYMLADVVVSASTDPEAFGRVAAEAQAMGRPVVASNHGAARETVVANKTGLLFAPGDAEALSLAIAETLSLDADAREALAAAAIAHIRANFTKEQMCAETLALYRELMEERAAAQAGP